MTDDDTTPPPAPSLTTTSSFWFGEGSSRGSSAAMILASDFLTITTGLLGLAAGGLWWVASTESSANQSMSLNALFDAFIPGLACMAFVVTVVLALRAAAHYVERAILCRTVPRFGRKSLLVSGSAVLFAFSCLYRAINIADEGAAMCRSRPTPFNAPVAGRFVATVGEIALVVQVSIFIETSAVVLGATRGLWSGVLRRLTAVPFSTVGTVLVAETCSWTGVLSGNSRFYCVEYVLWMVIAFTWAWDAAELLHKATQAQDRLTYAALLGGGLTLFCFNAFLEIPHFFRYEREADPLTSAPVAGIWECVHDAASPLWLKRLPFFVCYFIGCSWSTVAISWRFSRMLRRSHRD